jgi:GNAT superfamily N-acetyltransferase
VIVYRVARVEDIAATMAIRNAATENKLVSSVIGADEYRVAFTDEGRGFVGEADGEIVGFVCGRPVHRDIWALFVADRWWGQGVGSALMDHIEPWMFAAGVQEIVLSTEVGTRAERFYERRGWRRDGLTEGGEARFRLARPA